MTDPILSDLLATQQQPVGPLQRHIDWFARRLVEQGYAPITSREKLRLVMQLSQWFQAQQLGADAFDAQRLEPFLRYRQQQGRRPRHNRHALQTFLAELRDAGMLPVPDRQPSSIDVLAAAFADYLTHERGLTLTTQAHSLQIVLRVLQEQFGEGPLLLHGLGIQDVTQFLLQQITGVSTRRAPYLVSALRTFCRFLLQRGDIITDLATAIPSVADWRFSTVPKVIEPEQITRLLRSCDQNHPTGRRDDAILLLLARLGLRPGEVVAVP